MIIFIKKFTYSILLLLLLSPIVLMWVPVSRTRAATTTAELGMSVPELGESGWGTLLRTIFIDKIDPKFNASTGHKHSGSAGDGGSITIKATGEVFYTTAASCPTGSAEYTTARGFYIVGLPASGTSATSVGTALTNLENRAAGQHLHSVDPPSTSVIVTESPHTHGLDAATTTTGTGIRVTGMDGQNNQVAGIVNSASTGITASVNIAAFDSANGGSVVGTNAPYIHLLVCRQS